MRRRASRSGSPRTRRKPRKSPSYGRRKHGSKLPIASCCGRLPSAREGLVEDVHGLPLATDDDRTPADEERGPSSLASFYPLISQGPHLRRDGDGAGHSAFFVRTARMEGAVIAVFTGGVKGQFKRRAARELCREFWKFPAQNS